MTVSEGFFPISCSMNRHIINPPYQLRNRKKESDTIMRAVTALIDVIIHKIMERREQYRKKEKVNMIVIVINVMHDFTS